MGEEVTVSFGTRKEKPATVCSPVFYDPEGARQRIEQSEQSGIDHVFGQRQSARQISETVVCPRFSPVSPLAAWRERFDAARTDAFALCEKAFLEAVSLRCSPRSPVPAMIERVTGVALPLVPNTVSRGAAFDALWLGPDEWLLQSTAPREPGLERALRTAIAGELAAAVDVSGGHAVFEFTGSGARAVLQKGCPLDLHPRVFDFGQCAQSHFFKAAVVLWPIGGNGYHLICRRSFADYVACMLLDGAREFQGETL
jgi:sarcosine oxidase subunit gamma